MGIIVALLECYNQLINAVSEIDEVYAGVARFSDLITRNTNKKRVIKSLWTSASPKRSEENLARPNNSSSCHLYSQPAYCTTRFGLRA